MASITNKPRRRHAGANRAKGQALGLCALTGLLALLAGCTHSCLPGKCDYRPLTLPPMVEENPDSVLQPEIPVAGDPATVEDPQRTPRELTLREAFAMALENGSVGLQSLNNAGLVSDELATFSGRGLFGSDPVRVLALAPAISSAEIDRALARFDPLWATSMAWNKVDEPTQGLASFRNGSLAAFTTTLAKPLPTGGVAGLSFSTDYQLLSNAPTGPFSVINPSYTARLRFGVEQPLLAGFGTEINQLLPAFPGSTLFPEINGRGTRATPEGILVTRLRFDQQRAEFERQMNFLILNVESAYWRLYGAYVTLYAAEQGLRQSHAAYVIGKSKFDAGALPPEQLDLIVAQFHQFRAERIAALGRVLDSERTLRVLVGLPMEDGNRLVPADKPSENPFRPDWQGALQDCLTLRPELILSRKEVEVKHRHMLVQQNFLMPDLRFRADYTSIGLGNRLDGPATTIDPLGNANFGNALRQLSGNHFNNWTVGLTLDVPLGFRGEHAGLRQARLELAQSYHNLKDQERRAQIVLAKQYSRMIETSKLIQIRRQAREALAGQLRIRSNLFEVGSAKATLEFLLDAQRQWALALSQEAQAIVDYNIALSTFEFSRGTLLQHYRVVITDGPVPYCAEVRAVEHERERTRAIVLRERAIAPIAEFADPIACAPAAGRTLSLPALLSAAPTVPTDIDTPATTGSFGLKHTDVSLPPSVLEPATPAAPARLALPLLAPEQVAPLNALPPSQIDSGPPMPGASLGNPRPLD